MAEIKQGILGGVTGPVGPVVGICWRNRYYLRSKPRKSTKVATEKQVVQRSKMSLVSPFTSQIKDFLNKQYPLKEVDERIINGHEQVNSFLLKEGIEIIEGAACLALEKVIVSMGTLPPVAFKKINFLKDSKVKAHWDNSITNVIILPTDRLTMVVYNDYTNDFHIANNIAQRQDKYTHFELPNHWTEGNIHMWSVWKSADESVHSTSLYHAPIQLIDNKK